VEGFDHAVEGVFMNYNWPGNLRELKNVVKRGTLLTKGNLITLSDVPVELYEQPELSSSGLFSRGNEPEQILKALEAAEYNKSLAARMLNIDRKTLYNKLKLYNINAPERN
jgi:two-component system response regulator HydG